MAVKASLEPIWAFFLQEIRKCLILHHKQLNSSQDILVDVTYQAYLSAVCDLLENPSTEFACLERLLILRDCGDTSYITKVKPKQKFVLKLKAFNANIAQQAKNMNSSSVQQIFLALCEVVRSEQLQPNCVAHEAFAHILIASIVPLISLGAAKFNVEENLKFSNELESVIQSKIEDGGSTLLRSIINSFFVIEKAKGIFKNLCKPSDEEEVQKGLEAMCTHLKQISAYLKKKIRPIQSPLTWRDESETQKLPSHHKPTPFIPGSQEMNYKNQTVTPKTRALNCFLIQATASLKTTVNKNNFATSDNWEGVEENHVINSNFPLLYHIEKIIKEEFALTTLNTSQFMLSKMFSEFLLLEHIKCIRSLLFLQAGIIMEQFCYELICKREVATTWNQESWLTLSLHNCMSNGGLTWFCGYVSVKLSSKTAYARFNAQSEPEMTINYMAPQPLNLIIKPESLKLYNNIFRFLLDIKRSIVSLQKLSFKDLELTYSVIHNRLLWLRTWIMHFLNSVFCYFMECVLEPVFLMFDSRVRDCNSLEILAVMHYKYVRDVHRGCFLDQGYEFLNQPIREVANFANALRASWAGISTDDALNEMQHKFLYRYEYVVSVLNSAACRSTFPFVETLASALGHKHPM